MLFQRATLRTVVPFLIAATAMVSFAAQAQTGATVNTAKASDRVDAGTRLKNADVTTIGVSTPGPDFENFVVTVVLRLFGLSPKLGGGKAVNGKWQLISRCFGNAGTTTDNDTVKIKDGNAVYSGMMEGLGACNFMDFTSKLKGGAVFPMPADMTIAATTTPVHPGSGCIPDTTTLCLGEGGRFKATVEWRDRPGKSNAGVAFQEATDSGLFHFFAPENWEMVVKVLDGCDVNGHFWVYAAAPTGPGWDLQIVDGGTGEIWSASNPLGQRSPAFLDPEAYATCDA